MIFCRQCGAQMHETAVACPKCGAPADNPAAMQAAAAPTGYFSFQGRIGRKVYWLNYVIPLTAAAIAAAILDAVVFGDGTQILGPIVSLICLIPNLAGGVKRCHDHNKSGWFLLVGFIPLVGVIWLFVLLGCLQGTVGGNRFGPDPLLGRLGGPYRR